MNKSQTPKILIYDLETSLQTVAVFSLLHNDWIKPENIVTERQIISVAYKWFGETKVHTISVLDDPKRFAKDAHDDRYVVEEFHKVYSQSDAVVTHNGDAFDQRYILTRCLYHGLPPLPPVTSIDTKKIAKAKFYFNSNSLEYLGRYLGLGGKKHTSAGLWLRILHGSNSKDAIAAIKEMVSYNKRDVDLLESVFLKLRPYAANYINRQLFENADACPRCGSTKVQSRGSYYAQTRTYRRWQCMGEGCRGWFRTLKADKNSATLHRVL